MRESSTYQAILEEGRQEGRSEGRIEGVRETLLLQGTRRFNGPPPEHVRRKLDEIHDFERLEALAERIVEVNSWEELIAADA